MDHLHSFIYTFIQATDTRPGFISLITCICSALFAFVSAFISLPSLHSVQLFLAIVASLVAIVSGGFAIKYYRLQIQKLKTNV